MKAIKQPLITPISKDLYRLTEDYRIKVNGISISVPKGFVSDGISCPRIFWAIARPNGLGRAGALIHDWLYCNKGTAGELNLSRKVVDRIFRKILIESGVSIGKSNLLYRMVRWFGRFGWNKKRDWSYLNNKEVS